MHEALLRTATLALAVATLLSCAAETAPRPLPSSAVPGNDVALSPHKPEVATRADDTVVDDYFGQKVKDPFRWLEDGDSAEVKAWTEAENAVTRRYLDAIPGRDRMAARIKSLLEVGLVTAPTVREDRPGGPRRYFHTKREGDQNQPILYVRDGVGGSDRALIDPATLSSDATTALDWWYVSNDGAFVAWGSSEGGSEESTLRVRDVAKGADLPDRIPHTRHGSVAWLPGNKAFFYTRYPEPGSVPAGDEKYFRKVYKHVLGDPYDKDKLVFGEGRDKTDYTIVHVTPDGAHLVAEVSQGWQRNEVYVLDLRRGEKADWVPVAKGIDALFYPIARNDRLYLHTNYKAARYRLVAVEYQKPDIEAAATVLPEGPDVLEDVTLIGKDVFATMLHDAATTIERFGFDGHAEGKVALPALGSASVAGAWNGDEAFIQFTSFVVPPMILRLGLKTPASAASAPVWDRVGAGFTAEGISVSRMTATSKDGTSVPMFVIEKEGTVRDGQHPTVIWGYGGFNTNQTPAFSPRALLTVERGGIWVSAILRGGGEFGEAWHRAGMLGKKQNVFDDAIACAEKLIGERVTSPAKLAIAGGSNGGLLVAAVLTQRPELFRVGLSLVPLTDMLRYERFRIAKLWAAEYGSASNPDQWKFLYAYSPYHHVHDGAAYPSVLFTTAEGDSRVDPMHARKMAARLQQAQAADHPVLLRVESRAGHGQGKPVWKVAEEVNDELAFLFNEMGVPL